MRRPRLGGMLSKGARGAVGAANREAGIPRDMAERLSSAIREISKAEGRKEALEARLATLSDEVGRAKGRLSLKADVDEFLEVVQSVILQKAVGSYEKLLTALVNDVLKTEDRIGLDLYTERGLPALDIFVDADGGREDIMNGTGGSMTNVVSLGLRMIATVRSGMRKFVALDEPDCWIAPSKVRGFYRVIDDLGSKLGVQSLIISHHDVGLMPEGCAIVKMRKENGVVQCENDPSCPAWEESQQGIRSIRLVNFMSHKDTKIELSPGATMIVGENHIGKSVAVRAFRAVAYGEISSADIRHGETALEVEVEIEGGRVVRLTRQLKRNPINEWTLEDGRGNILEDDVTKTEYRTGGRSAAPEWVSDVLGISKFEGLEHQLSHQKLPVFLLNEVASKRASVLSIGRESSYVQKMIVRQRENSKRDQSTVKNGEVEVAKIMDELKHLDGLMSLSADAKRLGELSEKIRADQNAISQINSLIQSAEHAGDGLKKGETVLKIFSDLPSDGLERVSAAIQRRVEVNAAGKSVAEVERSLERVQVSSQALSGELPKLPKLRDVSAIKQLIDSFAQSEDGLARAASGRKESDAACQKVQAEIDEVYSRIGGVCPLCGSNVKHSHGEAV